MEIPRNSLLISTERKQENPLLVNEFHYTFMRRTNDRIWNEKKKEAHQTSSKRYFKSFLFRRRTESKQRRISARRLHKQRMERDNKRENFDFIISRHGIPSIFNSTVYNLLEQINFLPPPTHPPTEAQVKGKEKSNWSKTTTILKTHKQIKKSSIPKQNRRKKNTKEKPFDYVATNRIL